MNENEHTQEHIDSVDWDIAISQLASVRLWQNLNTPQPIRFYHPDKKMLRNQLGMFIIEVLMEYEGSGKKNPEPFVEKKIDDFLRILEGKRGF